MAATKPPRAVRRRIMLASLGALAAVGSLGAWRRRGEVAAIPEPLTFDELVDHVLPMAEERAQQDVRDDNSYLGRLAALAARTGWEPQRRFRPRASPQLLLEKQPLVFSLFQMERGSGIGAHDHQGYCALLKVLSGHPTITEYARRVPARSLGAHPFEVVRTARRVMRPGSLAAASDEHAPVHAIECAQDDVQLVDIFSFHDVARTRRVHIEDENAERSIARWGDLI